MKKMFKKVIKVCAVAVFMLNAGDGFAQNAKELTAIEDGAVSNNKRERNYDGEDKMLVKRAGSIQNAFVKFDISGQSGASINKATLKLYCADMEKADETNVDVFGTGNDWKETTLNYDNAPKPTRKLGRMSVDKKDQYYEVDVTSYVKRQLAADEKEVSFRLSDQDRVNNGIYFGTKEAASNKPLLVIE